MDFCKGQKMATKTKKTVKKTSVKKSAPVKKTATKKPAAKAVKKPVAKAVATKKPAAKPVAKIVKKVAAKVAPAPVQAKVIVKPVTPVVAARTSVTVRTTAPVAPARPANDVPVDFRSGDYVVYPAHGVGTIEGIETQTIAGMTVTLYAIVFEKDRMRLKIPVQKAQIAGLRKLSTGDRLKDALKTLQGRARVKRTMWSRRAQEYEAKINSGDPVQIAEVLRDLRRPKDDTEQSYSERQIYQSALERLAREVAAVQGVAEGKAVEHLETVLAEAA